MTENTAPITPDLQPEAAPSRPFYNTEVTYDRVFKIWWALFWRGIILTFLMVFVINFLVAVIAILIGLDKSVAAGFAYLIILPSSLFLGLWILRNVLRKKFPTFRIILTNEGITEPCSTQRRVSIEQSISKALQPEQRNMTTSEDNNQSSKDPSSNRSNWF